MSDDFDFDSLLKQGQDLKRRGALDRAEGLFSAVLRKHPDWSDGRIWRGAVRLQRKRYGEAREDFDAAVKRLREPGWHHLLRAEARLELGDYDGCLEDLQTAETWGRQNTVVLGLRGVAFALSDRWEEAFPAIDAALRRDPGAAMLLRLWGHIASNSTAALRRVARCALQSAQEHPKKIWLPLLGGSAMLYADFPEEAIPPLRRAAGALPDLFYAQLNYGAALMQAGPADLAEEVLDKAVALDRSQARARALRGEARLRRGNEKGAREDFIAALAIDHAGILPGQWEDGEAFSRFLAEEMPDNAEAQMNHGAYWVAHVHRPWRAVGFLSKAVALDPGKARAWALLGEAKFYCLRWIGALQAFARAVEEDRDGKMRRQWSDGPAFRLYAALRGD